MRTISKLWAKSKFRTVVFGVSLVIQIAVVAYLVYWSLSVVDANLKLAFLGLGVAFAFNVSTFFTNVETSLKMDAIPEMLSDTSSSYRSQWASGLIKIIDGIDTLTRQKRKH